MAATEDSEIPETGAVFTFGKSKFADNLPNKFWVKNDRVHQIACGDEHTGLIAESGRVFMFGPNDWGQLGLNDNKGVNKPSCVKSLKHETAKLIACGRSHTLVATESGHIYSFGSNSDGQLGYEGVTDQYLPKQIESLRPTKYKILSAGADNSVALTEDGKVYVWGGNEEGKLGLGEDIEIAHQPMLLQLDRPVVCVACGYYHTALVTDDGKLYTMGETDGGKLGLPEDLEDTKVPQEVTAIAEPVKWVACGSSHTVALTESGKCYVFGEGESGQLGLGTDVLSLSTPTHLKLPFKVSRVYCGQAFTALISEKGQLYTFGDGRHGKLAHGNDQFSNQYKPYHCKRFSHFNVKKVACGGCHMIVTAQPKAHSHNVESDEEVDEMKSLAETALLDSLNMTTGSPTLSRSLSAREKRRNEVTRSLSTLNQTLPVLTSKRGIHPLSATMPAIKPNHSKANGDLLHTTIVPKNRSLPRGKTLDIDHVVGPESTHHKSQENHLPVPIPRKTSLPAQGQVVDNSDDGSEGDDEGSDEGQHSVGHHGPKQVVEEGVVEEKLEADEDVMALTAELQSKIDEGSSEEEPLDEVDERSAGQDLPESITNTGEAGIHVEKVQEEMSSKDEITPTEKEKKESPVPGKKNPLPLPRKKQEKAEENEKEHEEEEEEEEETEEDEEVNEEEENSKKKNKKNKKEKEEKKKKDGKEDEKDKKKKDGEENEKDKKKKGDKKDKKKKDDDDIKDDKKKEGKEDNKKIDDDEDIKDKKKKDGKEDKKKKEDEESVKDKKKKDGKEDKKDKKEDEDTKDKKKKDEKEPKDKKKDKKSKKDKKKNGEEEEDEEEEEKEDKKKDKKGKKEKEDKKNKKEKNKKGDKDKKGEEEDEEDAKDEESNEKSKKKEKDTKTEDNEKSNDKSKKKGKDAKIEENEKNNSKVDKEKTDEALTKSNEKDDKANGKDENENTQVPVTAKKSRTCSIL